MGSGTATSEANDERPAKPRGALSLFYPGSAFTIASSDKPYRALGVALAGARRSRTKGRKKTWLIELRLSRPGRETCALPDNERDVRQRPAGEVTRECARTDIVIFRQ